MPAGTVPLMTTSNATDTSRPMWINPPRHDDPHDRVLVEYTQHDAAVVAAALRQAADGAAQPEQRAIAATLRTAATDLEAAQLTPAEADERLSREASWHPINQLHRILTTTLRHACRWLSPTAVAAQAIETAAAVAWSRGGEDAKQELLTHARLTVDRAAETAYPSRPREGR